MSNLNDFSDFLILFFFCTVVQATRTWGIFDRAAYFTKGAGYFPLEPPWGKHEP